MTFKSRNLLVLVSAVLALSPLVWADRELDITQYSDQLKGMWVAQMLGNYAGRQVEGRTTFIYEGATTYASPKSIAEYQVPWTDIAQGNYYDNHSTDLRTVSNFNGDDDTCFEYMNIGLLFRNSTPTSSDVTTLWNSYVKHSKFYIANRQARNLIESGLSVPDTGSPQRNWRWYAIDSQITTESLGAITPGLRQSAADLVGTFGGVSNSGYALHAAQFYGALYSEAPFTQNVETLIQLGLEVVPTTSRTHAIVSKAVELYQQDKTDNGTLDDFENVRDQMISHVSDRGRHQIWVESAMNTGMTSLALLYGDGNFMDTVEYGVRGGYDSDCNPATAGGVVGIMKGYDAIVQELTDAEYDVNLPTTYTANGFTASADSSNSWFNTLPEGNTRSLDAFVQDMMTVTQTQVVQAGGGVVAGKLILPDPGTGGDQIGALLEKPDPTAPKGLVAEMLSRGGTVTVSTSANNHNPNLDRKDMNSLIDGITDVTYNGVLPYRTYDGDSSPPLGGDYYQLDFSEEVVFDKLVFYEGDITSSANKDISNLDNVYGGFFIPGTVKVEILTDSNWIEVTDLVFSEDFENLTFYQVIEMNFDAIAGEAIRLSGTPGGTRPYTSSTEIEVYGEVPEPATLVLLAIGGLTLLRRRKRRL